VNNSNHPSHYLYHTTSLDNISSILCDGLLPADNDPIEGLNEDLMTTASDCDSNFPIDRRECVFCSPSLFRAATVFVRRHRENIEQGGLLGGPDGIVVVDGTQIANPLFVGNEKLITEANVLRYKQTPSEWMIASSYEDALQRYIDSLTRVSSDTLEKQSDRFEGPEIVVPEEITPEAIVSVLCDGHPLIERQKRRDQQ
jgi:hypothetical protein